MEAAAVLQRADKKGVTDSELRKFAADEAAACAGLHRAILRYGGQSSGRTGDFGRKVAALKTEGERLNLMARGQAWVVKRLDVLLGMPLDPETQAFLTLSYAHSAVNALLRQYRAPIHDPHDFESFYDVVAVQSQELL